MYVVDLQVVIQRFNIPLHTSNPEMCTHLRKRILIPHARVCTCVRACWHARKRACVRVCVRANACRRVGTECVHAATTTGLPSNSVCSPVMLFAGEAFPPRSLENKSGCRSISPQDIVGFRSGVLGRQRSLSGVFSGWVPTSLVLHKIKVDA